MLKFGNKEFRNLQEQVAKNMKDINFILKEEGVLNEFGIKVVGQEESTDDMPSVEDYKEDNPDWGYGDTFAIGIEPPYTLYVLTRANGTHANDYWFNIGSFPMPGPEGPEGPEGEVGPQGQTGDTGPAGTPAGFGTVTASATTVQPEDSATATVTVSGPNTALNLDFTFEIPKGEKGDTVSGEWGTIIGDLADQTDLVNALALKQNASNAVTTDTTQTITGQKTFTSTPFFDWIAVNTIGSTQSYIDFYLKAGTYYRLDTATFRPTTDNFRNLGSSTYTWKDLYLSGSLKDGTNSITIANIASKNEIPTKVSDLNNDSGFITGISSGDVTTALGYTPYNSSNPSGYITSSALSGYATETWVGNQGYLTSVAWGDVTGKPTFATVATSGDYSDLLNKPTIPAAQVNSDWNAASGVSQILNKPTLATVATSGSYSDLSNKPSIPSISANPATTTNTLTGIEINGTGYAIEADNTTKLYRHKITVASSGGMLPSYVYVYVVNNSSSLTISTVTNLVDAITAAKTPAQIEIGSQVYVVPVYVAGLLPIGATSTTLYYFNTSGTWTSQVVNNSDLGTVVSTKIAG